MTLLMVQSKFLFLVILAWIGCERIEQGFAISGIQKLEEVTFKLLWVKLRTNTKVRITKQNSHIDQLKTDKISVKVSSIESQ
jgi:hypothetical protein